MSFMKSVFATIGAFATAVVVWEGGKWMGRELKREFDNNPFPGGKVHRTEHAFDLSDVQTELRETADDIRGEVDAIARIDALEESVGAMFNHLWEHAEEFSELAIRCAMKNSGDYSVLGHELAIVFQSTLPAADYTAACRKMVYEDGSRILAFAMPGRDRLPKIAILFKTTGGLIFAVTMAADGVGKVLEFELDEEVELKELARAMADRVLDGGATAAGGSQSDAQDLELFQAVEAEFVKCIQLASVMEGRYEGMTDNGHMVFEPDQALMSEYGRNLTTVTHRLIRREDNTNVLVSFNQGRADLVLHHRADGRFEGIFIGGIFNYEISATARFNPDVFEIVLGRLKAIRARLERDQAPETPTLTVDRLKALFNHLASGGTQITPDAHAYLKLVGEPGSFVYVPTTEFVAQHNGSLPKVLYMPQAAEGQDDVFVLQEADGAYVSLNRMRGGQIHAGNLMFLECLGRTDLYDKLMQVDFDTPRG